MTRQLSIIVLIVSTKRQRPDNGPSLVKERERES